MVHNDYDNWQAKTVYGTDRLTDVDIWGSPFNHAVKMAYDNEGWAIFCPISSETTLRSCLSASRADSED
jgi:hypothetical protein